MKKVLVLFFMLFGFWCNLRAQSSLTTGGVYTSTAGNNCQGTIYDNGGPGGNISGSPSAFGSAVRIGNGTAGVIQLCFSQVALATSACMGTADLIVIYEANSTSTKTGAIATVIGFTGASGLIDSDSNGQNFCVTIDSPTGYAAVGVQSDCNTAAGFTANWTTIALNGSNACTGVVPTGSSPSSSVVVNQCGTSFNASSVGRTPRMTASCQGVPSGSSYIWNNLDCNTSTSGAPDAAYKAGGGDVSFSVENPTWYTFCPQTTGVWTLTLTKGSCVTPLGEPTTTEGYQYALFNGTSANLGAPISGGTNGQNIVTNTSLSVTVVSTPTCFQMVIDGFAGSECSYGFTLSAPAGLCSLPLALKLLNYSVAFDNEADAVKVEWESSRELNNKYIVIQRSSDNKNFSEIGKMDGALNSTTSRYYQFFDKGYVKGISYYRLKFVDINGVEDFSKIISINVNSDEVVSVDELSISPNPTEGITDLIINSKEDQACQIMVIETSTGKVLSEIQSNLNYGQNKIEIDLSQFDKGVYMIVSKMNQKVFYNRILKL